MSSVQSIIFNKNYWSLPQIKQWLRYHRFRPIKKVHETKNFYRYRLQNPSNFSRFITKKLPDNIELIIGYR